MFSGWLSMFYLNVCLRDRIMAGHLTFLFLVLFNTNAASGLSFDCFSGDGDIGTFIRVQILWTYTV